MILCDIKAPLLFLRSKTILAKMAAYELDFALHSCDIKLNFYIFIVRPRGVRPDPGDRSVLQGRGGSHGGPSEAFP